MSSPDVPKRESAAIGDVTLSVHWEGLPLRDAVARLEDAAKVAIFVDRGVDPTQLVNLTANDSAAAEILENLAAASSLRVAHLDSLLYLGPAHATAEVEVLAALHRDEVKALTPQEQKRWSRKTEVTWPRLTEPRDLVTRFLQDRGMQLIGGDKIPHDLWPAGSLPALTLSDELTILLAGFDLTYRLVPGKAAIAIIPITESMIAGKQPAAATKPVHASTAVKQHTKQLFTLRVQEQPVSKVLDQLEQQIHLDLKVDQAAIQAAGHSIDQRVSFEVKDADLAGLLQALLQPAGLTFRRDGEQLTIIPQ